MPESFDARVLATFRAQHGVISRTQALELGLGPARIDQLLRSQRWVRLAPSVYGVPGHRPSWIRSLWVAVLHAGPTAVVSHQSATRLQGFVQAHRGRCELIVPGCRRHPPAGVRWHRLDDLAPNEVVEVRGLPCTSAARCAVDVAADMGPARLRSLVEDGLVERRFTLEEVGSILGRVRRKGKPGVRALATVLDDLGPGTDLPRSELERLLDAAIGLAQLPAPEHEHPLPGAGSVRGFVDRCWPAARLIVEADGRRWHSRRREMVRDAQRTLQAQTCGYETLRFMWEQLRHDPGGSAAALREVYLRRLDLLG